MNKEFKKIIGILLIIGLNWSAISLISGTHAYFNDVEKSENNILTAGTLDFELYSATDFTPEITPTQNSARTITVNDNSTMDYNYRVRVENPTGGLCEYLYLDGGDSSGPQLLEDFISDEVLYPDKVSWIFEALLDGSIPGWEGKSCLFDLVFEASQENCAGGGFSDIEKISNTISNGEQQISSCMKINEIYYDPGVRENTSGIEDDPNDEWIELYNSCDYEVNIKNWYLEDNYGYEKLKQNYVINGHQFVVIAANASTWTYWPDIPDNAFKIALGGKRMFNGLANTNDRVVLYDDNNNKIDCVGWGNDDYCGFLDGPVDDVDEGHSIARNPKGYDTDHASDWEDLTQPNPGTNPHSEDGTLLLPPPTISSTPEPIIPEPIDSNETPSIVINEFLASGVIFNDFVEIYNNNPDFDIPLGGWVIKIESNDSTHISYLEGEIKSKDWLLIRYSDENILQANGVITLYNDKNKEIDKISYSDATIIDKSFARIPDGIGDWVDPIPTHGRENATAENLALVGLSEEETVEEAVEEIPAAVEEEAGETAEETAEEVPAVVVKEEAIDEIIDEGIKEETGEETVEEIPAIVEEEDEETSETAEEITAVVGEETGEEIFAIVYEETEETEETVETVGTVEETCEEETVGETAEEMPVVEEIAEETGGGDSQDSDDVVDDSGAAIKDDNILTTEEPNPPDEG